MQHDIPKTFQPIAQAVVNEWNDIHFSNETTLQSRMVAEILNPYKRGFSANVIDYDDYDWLISSPNFYICDDGGLNAERCKPNFNPNQFIAFARFAKNYFHDPLIPPATQGYSDFKIPAFVSTPKLPRDNSLENRQNALVDILGSWLDSIDNENEFDSATKVYDALLLAVEESPELISEEALLKLQESVNDSLAMQQLLEQNSGLQGEVVQQQSAFVEAVRNTEGVRSMIDGEMANDSFAKYNLSRWLDLLFCASLEDE